MCLNMMNLFESGQSCNSTSSDQRSRHNGQLLPSARRQRNRRGRKTKEKRSEGILSTSHQREFTDSRFDRLSGLFPRTGSHAKLCRRVQLNDRGEEIDNFFSSLQVPRPFQTDLPMQCSRLQKELPRCQM